MPFTTNYLLSIPVPGDPAQTSQWGAMENTGRSLVDLALGGVLPVTATGGDIVLTSINGAADQAKNAHFNLSGVLTGAQLILWPATCGRMFSVTNNCTGAFSVTLGVNDGTGTGSAGTTVVIPQGVSFLCYSDGTNIRLRQTGLSGSSLVITGDGSVSGTFTAGALVVTNNADIGGTLGVTGNANITGSTAITGIASVHTGLGGWTGNANFEVLAGGGYAISAYQNGGGSAFLARVDSISAPLATFTFGGSTVGSIITDGSSTSYLTSSDEILKDNIQDANEAGQIIDALRVRSWDWKSSGRHELFGFVAQEEVLVAPFAVSVGEGDKPWGRDDSKLVPLLVKEIQSLRARVAALEAQP